MTDAHLGDRLVADDESQAPVVRDKRRIDPETGQVRRPAAAAPTAPETSGEMSNETDDRAEAAEAPAQPSTAAPPSTATEEPAAPEPDLAAERLADLQRLQAEYVNYRKRVERDRDLARERAVAGMLESLLPVLDDVQLARRHGDLEGGPFLAIADKLDAVLGRAGLVRFGEVGEAFDPSVHEALMHVEAELAAGTESTTVVQVLQSGYQAGERVLRAARVAVADPEPAGSSSSQSPSE